MARTRSRRDTPDHRTAAAVCPDCGAEFVAGVETCSDCGVTLAAPSGPAERLTSNGGLVRIGHPFNSAFGRSLAEAFDGARIAHYFEPSSTEEQNEFGTSLVYRFEAFVRPEASEEATRLFQGLHITTSSEERENAMVEEPSLREFALAGADSLDDEEPLPSGGALFHSLTLPLWLGALHGFRVGSPLSRLIALGAVIVAIGLHMYAWSLNRRWTRERARQVRDKRYALEAKDWDLIETQARQQLEESERVLRGEVNPDDLDWRNNE